MLTAAISGAVIHPLMIRRDDETLRTQLRTLAERFLRTPGPVVLDRQSPPRVLRYLAGSTESTPILDGGTLAHSGLPQLRLRLNRRRRHTPVHELACPRVHTGRGARRLHDADHPSSPPPSASGAPHHRRPGRRSLPSGRRSRQKAQAGAPGWPPGPVEPRGRSRAQIRSDAPARACADGDGAPDRRALGTHGRGRAEPQPRVPHGRRPQSARRGDGHGDGALRAGQRVGGAPRGSRGLRGDRHRTESGHGPTAIATAECRQVGADLVRVVADLELIIAPLRRAEPPVHENTAGSWASSRDDELFAATAGSHAA